MKTKKLTSYSNHDWNLGVLVETQNNVDFTVRTVPLRPSIHFQSTVKEGFKSRHDAEQVAKTIAGVS